jgi:antitoxin (DNA-binding transcriptional repressor) of toxin-antitoxin stability system
MDISVTRFRASCLKLIRGMEAGGVAIDIERRGKIVARLVPPPAVAEAPREPWERLLGSGELLATTRRVVARCTGRAPRAEHLAR